MSTHSIDKPPVKRSLHDRLINGNEGGFLLLAPAVLVLLGLTAWPLVYSLWISLTDTQLAASGAAHFVGAANYLRILHDPIFLGSLLTTIKMLVIAVPLQLALGYICAAVLRAIGGMPGAKILRTIFILPTMMTPLCIALFWAFIFDPLIGIANFMLDSVHLPQLGWLSDPHSALGTLIFVYLWEWTPFTAILLLAGLLSISQSIYEAARIDGARWYTIALRIDLPLLGRVFAIAAILAIVEVLRVFDLVYGTTNGGPGTATLTNAVEIYRIGFQDFNTAYAAATSLVILVFTIAIAQWLARYLIEDSAKESAS